LGAVGANRFELEPLAEDSALARGEVTGEASTMRFPQTRRNDQIHHGRAERLLARHAECSFRSRVEFDDPSLMVDGDEAVQRRFEDRALDAFTPVKLLRRLLAIGDVLREAGDPVDLALVAVDRERAGAYPSDHAIGPHDAVFLDVLAARLLGLSGLLHALAILRMDGIDPLARRRIQALAASAPDFRAGRADVEHLVLCRVGKPEHLADVFRHLPEAQLASLQPLRARLYFPFQERGVVPEEIAQCLQTQ